MTDDELIAEVIRRWMTDEFLRQALATRPLVVFAAWAEVTEKRIADSFDLGCRKC